MRRDEMVKALEAQPYDTDVQFDLGGFLLDIVRVHHDDGRMSIVLRALAEDVDDAVVQTTRNPWFRVRNEGRF